jgi:protein SCO1/2
LTAPWYPRLILPAAALLLAVLLAVAASTLLGRGEGRPDAMAPAAAPSSAEGMKAGAFDPPLPAPEFSLPGTDGSTVTVERYRGKVVLLTFGFSYCAAVCPTTLATLAQARSSLGEAAERVQVIFVTVDPERDDAAHLRQYLAAFDPGFAGATGTPEALADVRRKYGVTAEKRGTGSDYAMAHTSSIFLIDRAGKLRAMMPFGHDARDFVHDINFLLAN